MKTIKIPKISKWLLTKIQSDYNHSPTLGDLEEEFFYICENESFTKAKRWYRKQLVKSLPSLLKHKSIWSSAMLTSNLKITYRNLKKQKMFSFINITGLALGVTVCLLIYLFVSDELSYDKFHKNRDHLFRVERIGFNNTTGEVENRMEYLPPAMGPELERFFDEIKYMSRHMWGTGTVRYQDKIFRETIDMVDAPFFQMFSFPLISGNPETVLKDDFSVVLTQTYAEKYFGSENPIGKMMTITFGQTSKDFIVTGVSKNPPSNSSLQFNMHANIKNLTLADNNPQVLADWKRWYFPFYVQLQEPVFPKHVEQKMPQFCTQFFADYIQRIKDRGDWTRSDLPFTFGFQSIKDIYLDSRGLMPSFILFAIAVIILIIACVNFTNISIGLSSVRSREVGMKKVLGAKKQQLIRQFWSEAILTSFLATGFGLCLTSLLLPQFNSLSGKQLSISEFLSGSHLLAVPFIAFIMGIFAGSYPALVMSNFRPIDILKNKFKVGGKTPLTKGLVVLQFSLCVSLVISAIILGNQANYLIDKDLGYNKEGMIIIRTQENEQKASEDLYQRFRSKAISNHQILGITASNREFGQFLPSSTSNLNGTGIHFRFNRVDPNFVSTFGINITQGRDFLQNSSTENNAILVNEKFIEALGPQFELGKIISNSHSKFPFSCRIVGVMENSHFRSLLSEIEPLVLYIGKGFSPARDRFSRMFIRVKTDNISESLAFLEKTWKDVQPNKPFISSFFDETLKRQYTHENQWSTIVQFSSIFSIIIACMGIFGLTAITISRRVKEIGIRKVLGATVPEIVQLVIKEFILLVTIANIIAWPIVYWIMNNVLQNYPNRIGIGLHYFFITGIGTVFISILTICFLSVKAALANPVDSLRYE